MRKPLFFSLVFLVFAFHFAAGQSSESHKYYISGHGGIAQSYGDIQDYNNHISKLDGETGIAYGIRLAKYVSPVYAAHLQYVMGQMQSARKIRNIKTSVDFHNIQLGGTANLSSLLFGKNPKRKFVIYGLTGISVTLFESRPERISNGLAVDEFGHPAAKDKTQKGTSLGFPMGAGISYNFANNFSVNFGTTLNLLDSDRLDGIISGNRNDAFYFTNLSLTYNIFYNPVIEKVEDNPLITEEPITLDTTTNTLGTPGIDIDYLFPDIIVSGSEFDFQCIIHKHNYTGKAELMQIFPIGLNITDTIFDNASNYNFKNYILKLYWDDMPQDSVIVINYHAQLDDIFGYLPVTTVFYVEQTDEEYTFDTNIFIEKEEPVVLTEETQEEEMQKENLTEEETITEVTDVSGEEQPGMPEAIAVEETEEQPTITGEISGTENIAGEEPTVETDTTTEVPDETTVAVETETPEITEAEETENITGEEPTVEPEITTEETEITTETTVIEETEIPEIIAGEETEIVTEAEQSENPEEEEIISPEPEKTGITGEISPTGEVQEETTLMTGTTGEEATIHQPEYPPSTANPAIEYRVQIRAAYKARCSIERLAKRYDITEEIKEDFSGNWYRYSVGSFNSYSEAKEYRKLVVEQYGVLDAFVVAYKDGRRLNSISEIKDLNPGYKPDTQYMESGRIYRVQILALLHNRVEPSTLKEMYGIDEEVTEEVYGQWRKYVVGGTKSLAEAKALLKKMKKAGISDAFIVIYDNGSRLNVFGI